MINKMIDIVPVFVSEVSEGYEEDEDDEAGGETDQESDVVDWGVELVTDPSLVVSGWLVHWDQVLVTQVLVWAAGDVARFKVRHQVTLALHESPLISRQTSVCSLSHQLIGQRIQHFLHSCNNIVVKIMLSYKLL